MDKHNSYKQCRVAICTGKRSIEDGILLHAFPSNENRRKQWMKACNTIKKSSLFVCSNHFSINDCSPSK